MGFCNNCIVYSSFHGLKFLLGSGSPCPGCDVAGHRQGDGQITGRDWDSGQCWGAAQGKAGHGHQSIGELRPDISQVWSIRSNALKVCFYDNLLLMFSHLQKDIPLLSAIQEWELIYTDVLGKDKTTSCKYFLCMCKL